MRGLAPALVVSLIVAIASPQIAGAQSTIPDQFAFDDGRLIWMDASGTPAAEDCDVRYGHTFDDSQDDGGIQSVESLREVLQTRRVISGTVTATAIGVRRDMPYTILQIDTDTADRVYLLYAAGRLPIGGRIVCLEDPTVPGIPAIGDPIVFLSTRALDATRTLHLSFWVVYEHDGAVITGADIELGGEHEPKSVREFTARLRAWQREAVPRVKVQ